MKKVDGYSLSKQWFDFVINTNEMVRPIHGALYFWIIELNNRLQWKQEFGLPTDSSMQHIGIKGRQHYKKALDDLIKWGLIELISKSTNQYSPNVISLVLLDTKSNKQNNPLDTLPDTLLDTKGSKQGYKQPVLPDTKSNHSKTEEQTYKTSKTLKEENEALFFLNIFKEEYERIKKIPYVINDADKLGINDFLNLFRQAIKETDNEKFEYLVKEYFRAAIKHPEDFHRERMTLSYMVKNFNTINNSLFTGKSIGVNSMGEREELEKYFKIAEEIPKAEPAPEEIPEEPEIPPPTLEEVKQYFIENGFSHEGAEICYKSFTLWVWKSKSGRFFTSEWKQRAREFFFKPNFSINADVKELDF